MRKIIIAGNWKMNKDLFATQEFMTALSDYADSFNQPDVSIVVAPPYPFLITAKSAAMNVPVMVSAQDVSLHDDGAYTGEVSVSMLTSLGVDCCIIGHSERRQYHAETDSEINLKLKKLLLSPVLPIVCIGETLEQREKNQTEEVLLRQLSGCFEGINIETGREMVIAYEPVWAIGTGRTATPIQAQEAHLLIRNWLSQQFGTVSDNICILYGGSVKPDNIKELLAQPDIDGGLIGGASLKVESFIEMIETAVKIMESK